MPLLKPVFMAAMAFLFAASYCLALRIIRSSSWRNILFSDVPLCAAINLPAWIRSLSRLMVIFCFTFYPPFALHVIHVYHKRENDINKAHRKMGYCNDTFQERLFPLITPRAATLSSDHYHCVEGPTYVRWVLAGAMRSSRGRA